MRDRFTKEYVLWPLLPLLLLLLATEDAQTATLTDGADSAHISAPEVEATVDLLTKTDTFETVCRNFASISNDAKRTEVRFVDSLLSDALFDGQFVEEWPQEHTSKTSTFGFALPSPELQALCWLAESNKRKGIELPEVRAKQRADILHVIEVRLETEQPPELLRGYLEVAYRTTFYSAPVIPMDGGDEIIELFKRYISHGDERVHNFVRDRLAQMGYLWSARYDEIRNLLLQKAPELRARLTGPDHPAIPVDRLSGLGTAQGRIPEVKWLALPAMTPAELGLVIEKGLKSYRSLDIHARKALDILVRRSLRRDGNDALNTLLDISRKGIYAQNTVFSVALIATSPFHSVVGVSPEEPLRKLLLVLPQAMDANWRNSSANETPAHVCQQTLDALRQEWKKIPHDEAAAAKVVAVFEDAMLTFAE